MGMQLLTIHQQLQRLVQLGITTDSTNGSRDQRITTQALTNDANNMLRHVPDQYKGTQKVSTPGEVQQLAHLD